MKNETAKAKNERLAEAIDLLEAHYADTKPALNYASPYELLIAVMLSAQCTDLRVNIVTDELFKKYNSPEAMVSLEQDELQALIKSCGLGKSKSKNILATSRILIDEYSSKVPDKIEVLETLPGVGRKTANVVASVAYGVDAIAVDTHVFRVSNRIGLAEAKDVKRTEEQLMKIIPKEKWSKAHHWLIWHGRRVCKARKPECEGCFLNQCCAYFM